MTSHDLWNALPEHVKAKRRRQYPNMSDKGIRLFLWRRRGWSRELPPMYHCLCAKLHKAGCPNA